MDDFIKLFVRVTEGKWTCVTYGIIDHPNGQIRVSEGSTFTTGTNLGGVDLAELLDAQYKKHNGHDKSL